MKFFIPLFVALAVTFTMAESRRIRREAEPSLAFTVTPPVVVQGKDDELSLDCRVVDAPSDMMPIYLLIQRTNENTGTVNLALQMPKRTDVLAKDDRTTAEGNTAENEGEETFLTLKIKEPEEGEEGEYNCQFLYLAQSVQTITETANVTLTEVPEEVPVVAPVVAATEEEEGDCCEKNAEEIEKLKASIAGGAVVASGPAGDATCQAAFSVQLKEVRGYLLRSNEVILFNTIVTNKGAAYDVTTGAFTAPCSGQYFFSLTLTSLHSTSGNVEGVIRRGEKKQVKSHAYSSMGYDEVVSGSTSVVLTLEQGETVDVLLQASSSGEFIGQENTVFSGYYLFP